GLTSFYLMIALGGALGAVAVGLIAPHVLSGVYELPISLLCVAALALWLNWHGGWSQRMLWAVVAVAMAVVLGSQVAGYNRNALVVERSFYGTLRVLQSESAGAEVRTLYHGTIKHGAQSLDAARRMAPSTYYGLQSGIGLTLRLCCDGPKRVGAIGLGTGTVAVYGRHGDEFRFYEINPQVVQLASSLFTYLRETPAHVEITMGDARLSLQSEAPQGFDVLIVDAFSGDAIPVHLLTKEAFGLYFRHLKPNGILAVHVSNQFLDLAPVTQQLAAFYRYPAIRIHNDAAPDRLLSATDWVLITRDRAFLERPEVIAAATPIDPHPGLRLWTDDYNNLFQVMKLVSIRAR
ncbi:MAG: spermidine synthase, partial [Bryobacteraceae bacterium]